MNSPLMEQMEMFEACRQRPPGFAVADGDDRSGVGCSSVTAVTWRNAEAELFC